MALPQIDPSLLSEKQYLEIERNAEIKSEFYQGETFAMAGASVNHNRIISNLVIEIGYKIKKTSCRIYSSDMRLKVQENGLYAYPDIMVTCDNEEYADEHKDTLLNPKLIIEVLSKSTESYDRGHKFEMFRALISLNEYILVSQYKPLVEHYLRQDDSRWLFTEYTDINSTISLLNIEINIADIYSNVF